MATNIPLTISFEDVDNGDLFWEFKSTIQKTPNQTSFTIPFSPLSLPFNLNEPGTIYDFHLWFASDFGFARPDKPFTIDITNVSFVNIKAFFVKRSIYSGPQAVSTFARGLDGKDLGSPILSVDPIDAWPNGDNTFHPDVSYLPQGTTFVTVKARPTIGNYIFLHWDLFTGDLSGSPTPISVTNDILKVNVSNQSSGRAYAIYMKQIPLPNEILKKIRDLNLSPLDRRTKEFYDALERWTGFRT